MTTSGCTSKDINLLEAVWGVLPEAVIGVEVCPLLPQLEVHSRLGRIWAAITGNPIWSWRHREGVIKLVVLYDADVSDTSGGYAPDLVRERVERVTPAAVRVDIEYYPAHSRSST